MGLTAVHTAAGRGSKSGVRSVLLRMVDEGLVQEVPGGYVFNRDHLAAPAVELLAALHGELTNRIRAAVNEWRIPPLLVGMFGSAARRDGDASSDIDVLVVSEDPPSMTESTSWPSRSDDGRVIGPTSSAERRRR